MSIRTLHLTILLLLIAAAAAPIAVAQAPATETTAAAAVSPDTAAAPASDRAAELARLGLNEDPGPDPDPKKEWVRNGRRYTINKIGREWTLPPRNGREGWIQPNHHVHMDAEIYQQNEDFVWVFIEVLAPTRPPAKYRTNAAGRKIKVAKYSDEDIAMFRQLRDEFDTVKPPKSEVVVKLVDASEGLPTTGSWRNSAAVADMNGDGHADIVAPPQRSASKNYPTIFLGDGKGKWAAWPEVRWPERPFSYGSVSVGDLNRDGKQDLVFASHLETIYVMLGDGKGGFRDANEGLPRDFATRRARLADVDRDGDLDIVAITEGPTRTSLTQGRQDVADLRVYLNDGKAKVWAPMAVSSADRQLGGDWLGVGDVNGDKKIDVVGSSVVMHGTDTIWLGAAKPATYTPFGRGFFPWYSLYHATAVGRFARKDRDDIVTAFFRSWPEDVDPDLVVYPESERVTGLERIWWDGKKFDRSPIVRGSGKSSIFALDAGDVDRDGNLDVVYLDETRVELVLLLGSGKGTFSLARFDAPDLPVRRAYDLTLADLDKDGRLDMVILYESDEEQSNGLIKVLLNRGK